MAYQFKVYAPTEGVQYLYVYYDGVMQGVCFPEGIEDPCWKGETNAGTVAVEAVLEDGYVTTAWVVNENGTKKINETDNYLWNHSPKSSCTTLAMRIEVEQVEEITRYYATLNFDAKGGEGAPDPIEDEWTTNKDQNVEIEIPRNKPKKTGYVFQGWSLKSNGSGDLWQPLDTIELLGSKSGEEYTLYAVWSSSSDGGVVHICETNGKAFSTATPYIWTGSKWEAATPYIWTGGKWKKGV